MVSCSHKIGKTDANFDTLTMRSLYTQTWGVCSLFHPLYFLIACLIHNPVLLLKKKKKRKKLTGTQHYSSLGTQVTMVTEHSCRDSEYAKKITIIIGIYCDFFFSNLF